MTSIFRSLLYKITLLNSVVRNRWHGPKWPWWTQVDKDVIVGALPLHNLGHLQILTDAGISSVLSIVEPHEVSIGAPFARPIQPTDWPAHITQKFLSIPDYQPIPVPIIEEALLFIQTQSSKGPVYIHCKAGRGRSIVIVLCYLLKQNPQLTPEEALMRIRALRGHVCPNQEQLRAVHMFHKRIKHS